VCVCCNTRLNQRKGGGNSHTGSAIGAGFSYAFMDNLAARIEEMYISLKTQERTDTILGSFTLNESATFHFTVVRVGVIYKF
jgi:opacity protein-like surface antigen